jgi:hypothetical protein
MSRGYHPLSYVDVMIDFLESKIESNAVTPAVLDALQKRLDAISAAHRSGPDFDQFYPHMLELQTLIYGEGNQEKKANLYLKEAVRETGSVNGLHSKLLRQYVVNHSRPMQAAAVSAQHAAFDHNVTSAPRRRKFFTLRKLQVGFVTVIVLVGVAAGTLHFVPRAAALPILLVRHSEIIRVTQAYESLTAQYKVCSANLAQRKGTIDFNDFAAVDTYNNDAKSCNAILQQLHQAQEQYNSLVKL